MARGITGTPSLYANLPTPGTHFCVHPMRPLIREEISRLCAIPRSYHSRRILKPVEKLIFRFRLFPRFVLSIVDLYFCGGHILQAMPLSYQVSANAGLNSGHVLLQLGLAGQVAATGAGRVTQIVERARPLEVLSHLVAAEVSLDFGGGGGGQLNTFAGAKTAICGLDFHRRLLQRRVTRRCVHFFRRFSALCEQSKMCFRNSIA